MATAVAFAQDQGAAPPDAAPRPYQGVVPGEGQTPAHARPRGSAQLLTWPGFQMRPDGASRFFLQLSKAAETSSRQSPGRFEVTVSGAKVRERNNLRPLETRYFNTPVRRAQVERRKGSLAFVIELRADVTPTVHSETGADGLHYLFVEFPPGEYLEASP